MIDSDKTKLASVSFLIGVIVAIILFPKKEIDTIYETKIDRLTDTLYIKLTDTVYLTKTKIKTEFIRDTVLIDYKPKISRFETMFPFNYGSTKVSGEVLGEVLKMTAINNYDIPVVNNTIKETNTERIVVKPKGIYLGAGINSMLEASAKVSYLDNKYLFEYQFSPMQRFHQLGVSKKIF